MNRDELRARAKKRLAAQRRRERDPRFVRVLGRFVSAGLLTTNREIVLHRDPVPIKDALYAGKVEPRIMELLPAVVLKRPALLAQPLKLPSDLEEIVRGIRHGRESLPDLRGVSSRDYLQWITRVGRKGQAPSVLKSFRFQQEDVALLRALKDQLGAKSETAVLRLALRALDAQQS